MNILAFDTSLNKTYIALKTGGETFSQIIESTDDKYHSAFLIQETVNILAAHSLKPQDIELFATNVGPGSFTGIRVGLTVARGLSQGTNKPVICTNSLELIANAYGLPAIVVMDARKNKAYVGNDKIVELISLDDLLLFLKKFEGKIVADNKMHSFLYDNKVIAYNFEKVDIDYGQVMIKLAEQKYSFGDAVKWSGIKPLYIQPPPIHGA